MATKMDPEVRVTGEVLRQLGKLQPAARMRVSQYVYARILQDTPQEAPVPDPRQTTLFDPEPTL